MLSAVLHGKKLGTGFAGTRLKIGETQGAEDVLTASVFERIAYLPNEVFISFIQRLFKNKILASPLDEIEFWAGWQRNCRLPPPSYPAHRRCFCLYILLPAFRGYSACPCRHRRGRKYPAESAFRSAQCRRPRRLRSGRP